MDDSLSQRSFSTNAISSLKVNLSDTLLTDLTLPQPSHTWKERTSSTRSKDSSTGSGTVFHSLGKSLSITSIRHLHHLTRQRRQSMPSRTTECDPLGACVSLMPNSTTSWPTVELSTKQPSSPTIGGLFPMISDKQLQCHTHSPTPSRNGSIALRKFIMLGKKTRLYLDIPTPTSPGSPTHNIVPSKESMTKLSRGL